MRFPDYFIDEIKTRLPISSVIGRRVQFDPKKSNPARGVYWACCPFHGEKTPSFSCDDPRGFYHCFGCGRSGDVFQFLIDLDGLSFNETVERLAEQAGLPLPQPDPQAEQREKRRATLHDALEEAAKFFEENLHKSASAEAANARAYLGRRGVSPEMRKHFRLGYAPAGYHALNSFLRGLGLEQTLITAAGLAIMPDDGAQPYDRFRERVIFPILDMRGRVIAFGGRALSADAAAKYLNSPETELFHKGRVLYNIGAARGAMRGINGAPDKRLIVVEGYMDVVSLAGAGFGEAVAPLGTALTEEQLGLLWRFCPQPILCFDGDKAGISAAYRAMDRALPLISAQNSLSFMILPEGQDPDDIIRNEGRAGFAALLAQAAPLADILWRRETAGQNFAAPESRAALESRLRQAAALIKDNSLRSYYMQDIKQRLWSFFRPAYVAGGNKNRGDNRRGFDARNFGNGRSGALSFGNNGIGGGLITNALAHSPLAQAAGAKRAQDFPPRDMVILALLAAHPALGHENFDALAELHFDNPELQAFYRALLEILGDYAAQEYSGMACGEMAAEVLAQKLEQKGGKGVLAKITAYVNGLGIMAAQPAAELSEAREVLRQALSLYRRAYSLRRQIQEIEKDILDNPAGGSFARLAALRRELSGTDNLEASMGE